MVAFARKSTIENCLNFCFLKTPIFAKNFQEFQNLKLIPIFKPLIYIVNKACNFNLLQTIATFLNTIVHSLKD